MEKTLKMKKILISESFKIYNMENLEDILLSVMWFPSDGGTRQGFRTK
jgi:hypothetical protein